MQHHPSITALKSSLAPKAPTPSVPNGFKVTLFASGLDTPRYLLTAPNGDIFVAESYAGRIRVLRDADGDGHPEINQTFATGLRQPFGLAFYPPGPSPEYLYVANTDGIVRFPYRDGDLKARSRPMHVADLSSGGRLTGGGHWTRDIVFSKDGSRLFASIGSKTNVDDETTEPEERDRARIFQFNPDGSNRKVYAWGLRNAVGIAIHPETGELWASVNERDGLGDDLVPDYITRVREGGFYGWPWFYLGKHQDPRHPGARPDLADKVLLPDVLVQAHSAPSTDDFLRAAISFPTIIAEMLLSRYMGPGTEPSEQGTRWCACLWITADPTGCMRIF